VQLDVVAQIYANLQEILKGTASPEEAARFFMRHNAKEPRKISVPDAVTKCLAQATADGKSSARVKQLEWGLKALAAETNLHVADLSPSWVSRYLTEMVAGERTKKNARDVLGYFGRWLVLHGYLSRGTNLIEGVQRYSMKPGEIQIFTPREVSLLLAHASAKLLPYVAIGAFAGLRGAEIQRLDWSEVEILDPKPNAKQRDFGWIEVKAEKSKTDVRRLVPIKPNLAAWLKDYKQKDGPVCPFKNVVNELMDLVVSINNALPKATPEKERMVWKKNGLRHSYISYRVAECADVARVADESGNSPAIIKANYLRRVKPDAAAEWFTVGPSPEGSKKIISLAAATRRKATKVAPEPAATTA
jgi:integrase